MRQNDKEMEIKERKANNIKLLQTLKKIKKRKENKDKKEQTNYILQNV